MNDVTMNFDPMDVQENKAISILAYISFLFFVPLLTKPNSHYAKFHANQGLVLFIASIASSAVSFIPFVGAFLAPVLGLAITVFSILGIVYSAQGKAMELPLIGTIKILQ